MHTRCCHKGAFLVVASSWPSWCGAERTCGLPHQSLFTPQGPSTEKGGGPGKLSMPPTPTSPSLSALLPRPNRGRPLSHCPLNCWPLQAAAFLQDPFSGRPGGLSPDLEPSLGGAEQLSRPALVPQPCATAGMSPRPTPSIPQTGLGPVASPGESSSAPPANSVWKY